MLKHKANEGHRQCWPVVVFTKVILKFKVLFLKPHTSKCLCLEEKGHAWRFGIDLYSSSNFYRVFSRVEYSEYLFVFCEHGAHPTPDLEIIKRQTTGGPGLLTSGNESVMAFNLLWINFGDIMTTDEHRWGRSGITSGSL